VSGAFSAVELSKVDIKILCIGLLVKTQASEMRCTESLFCLYAGGLEERARPRAAAHFFHLLLGFSARCILERKWLPVTGVHGEWCCKLGPIGCVLGMLVISFSMLFNYFAELFLKWIGFGQ